MKSIKRGRGPSMVGGITSICMALFGLFWTFGAGSIGGPFFALFGLVFIAIAVTQAVYNFKNATGKNRYSEYDITDGNEEVDPLNERFGNQTNYYNDYQREEGNAFSENEEDTAYCPYCGTIIGSDFQYCHECGKKMPW